MADQILRRNLTHVFILCLAFSLFACNQAAESPQEAAKILTSAPTWTINEISVNDAVTFKDGKMIQQFGGIDFDRYMERVQFKPGGDFEGYFKGDTKPMILKWKVNEKDITVAAVDGKGGAWTILPGDVHKDSFFMKTQSTAYDYPRLTKIALKFKLN